MTGRKRLRAGGQADRAVRAYDRLHALLEEYGTSGDFEALDDLWIATGRADDYLQEAKRVQQQSDSLRRQQGRTWPHL